MGLVAGGPARRPAEIYNNYGAGNIILIRGILGRARGQHSDLRSAWGVGVRHI